MSYRVNKDLMYVIGVLHGDGTICNGTITQIIKGKEYGKYRIKLAVKDKDFAKRFHESLMRLCLNPIYSHYPNKIYNGTSDDIYEIVLNNKLFVQWIDKKIWIIPKYRTHLIEIIRGFFDSEGSIVRTKHYCNAVMSQNQKNHLDFILKILKVLSLDYALTESRSRETTRGIEYSINISARKMHRLLGKFTIKRKEEVFQKFKNEVKKIGLSNKETEFLEKNRVNYSYPELSKIMKKNRYTLKYHCRRLNLRRKNYERR